MRPVTTGIRHVLTSSKDWQAWVLGEPGRGIASEVSRSRSTFLLVRAQRHAEHVSSNLAARALLVARPCELEEHLPCDVRERSSRAGHRRDLRHQNHRFAHDRIDE